MRFASDARLSPEASIIFGINSLITIWLKNEQVVSFVQEHNYLYLVQFTPSYTTNP